MPINIGKNLKIEPTNDTKVSKFVRNYKQIHDYIEESDKPLYYAYYTVNGSYYSPEEDCCVIYSTELLTNQGTSTTGSKSYQYSYNFMGITSTGSMDGYGTLNISEFTDDGFKTNSSDTFYHIPGLDIYKDNKIRGNQVIFYCYQVEDIEEHTISYAFSPVIIDEYSASHYYYHNLISSSVNGPTYGNIVSHGYWNCQDELEYRNGNLTYGGWAIYTRCPEYDLYDLGTGVHENLYLYDLLMALLPSAEISYINLPSGATFNWYLDELHEQEIPNPYKAKEGQKIYYSLKYADGSYCDDEFTVSGDTTLDLSTLEPNLFKITVTANKPLTYVKVHQEGYQDYSVPPDSNNYVYVLCKKNDNITLSAKCAGWTEIDKITDDQNASSSKHNYTNVTQNISETYQFNYVAYDSIRIFLKDENNNYVEMTHNPWWNYITWTPSDSNKFNPVGVIHREPSGHDYYNAYKDTSISVDYVINVPNYSPITGTFDATSATPTKYYEQTKTLVPLVTYTIVPYPNDATVTLAASGYTQQGNSITVPKGTNVVWMVAKEGYETQSGNISVTSTQSVSVVLEESIIYGVDVKDYQYTNDNKTVVLTKYIGAGGNIVTPGLEEIIE